MTDDYVVFQEKWFRKTGIDLKLYKEEQMKRRLNTLRIKRGRPTFLAYFHFLEQSEEHYLECLDRITINVTEFYRNRPRWEVLENTILPKLLKARKGPLRVWSAACSSGEEPYTLSFLLSKYLSPSEFQITATDLDRTVLEVAKQARYNERSLVNMTDKEKLAYFDQENAVYALKKAYQTPVRFMQHNLLKDAAPGSFDLIVCRNVLIYFTDEAKAQIYKTFSGALHDHGYLFVGSTEQIFRPESYQMQSAETFFYSKLATTKTR